MNQSRLKTVLFIVAAGASMILLAFALQQFNIFSPNAGGAVPQIIGVSNITDTGAAISWSTGTQPAITSLQWGDTKNVTRLATDTRDTRDKTTKARKTHYVELTELKASTTYYYRIISGDTTYPALTEEPYSFSTLPKVSETQPSAVTIYGDVGVQDTDVIIRAYVPGDLGYSGVIPQTTVLNTDGTWVLNLASARKSTGSYLTVKATTPIALIAISADGKGTAKTLKANESPITLDVGGTLTQGTIDGVLLTAVTVTPSSTTPTPTVTAGGKQDFPLNPIGTTSTPTPTTTVSSGDDDLTKEQLLASFASPSVSNVTDTSLSMMYVTETPVVSTLNWGTSVGSLTANRLDDRDQSQATSRYIHHYTLPSLSANTQYYFKPTADNTIRTFTTPATISAPSGQTVITGTLTNGSGECLVRTQIKRNTLYSSIITTLPSSTNAWSVNIKPVRTAALDTYITPVATDTVLTNVFCITTAGDVYYRSAVTTVQNAVTSGISLTLTKLQ